MLVYASSLSSNEGRLQSVSVAVDKIARLLKLPMEIVTFREESGCVYVYYENGRDEPVPIYFDSGGELEMEDVYKALRNMMFVLSFHPKHSALKHIRKEIMLFS
jgi:hypothetical protein